MNRIRLEANTNGHLYEYVCVDMIIYFYIDKRLQRKYEGEEALKLWKALGMEE